MFYKFKERFPGGYNKIYSILGLIKPINYKLEDTIIVCGSPRSGSTWLAEVLSKIDGYRIIFEPLYLRKNPELTDLGFNWRTYIEPGTEWREAQQFFQKVLRGKISNEWTNSGSDFRTILKSRALIVKFVRANRLLKWLTERFSTKKPILMIRHPCAVISSQLSAGWWDHVVKNPSSEHPVINKKFIDKYPEFFEILKNIRTPEEKLTFTWCMDHFIPLSLPQPHPWTLVCYENLVTNGKVEIERICKSLNISPSKKIYEYLNVPSSTSKGKRNFTPEARLSRWKKNFSKDQIERILRIVWGFGFEFYSEKPEPDYDQLGKFYK